ncbi:MAG: 30S ribosomal protein S3 [Candidatus Pacebacteria bacterium]|nr:30S ribosomal protein S3 [Candidatus Paceibacterota bacterium]
MTHVAHPFVQRLGIIRDWRSRWFAADQKQYREYIRTDAAVRKLLTARLKGMYVANVEIERDEKVYRIIISTSRPGLVIGRSGEGATKLKKDVDLLLRTLKLTEKPEIKIDIEEVRSPETSAAIVAQMVVEGLEKRMPFRRVMKQTAEKVMANRDIKGVRIIASGRLGGAEMARKEQTKKGRVPLQTLRADIDFARERAILPYGSIGIKVWIYRGDVFANRKAGEQRENTRGGNRRPNRSASR